jgi:pilus assembly protein Flp/PilA
MRKLIIRLIGEEAGATAIEYGLICAAIAAAIIAILNSLGTSLVSLLTFLANTINTAH